MFEVIIECLSYIRDVPLDLTQQAVLSGELRKGSVVGLIVSVPDVPNHKIPLEVKLTHEGQVALVTVGLKVPLVEYGDNFRFADNWTNYLMRPVPRRTDPSYDASSG
jgi:hypothetical protein